MTQAPHQTRFRASLKPRERLILTMRYSDEMELAEIGQVLDLPPSVVEQVLLGLKHRARYYRRNGWTSGGAS